jgi:hypothetical protein
MKGTLLYFDSEISKRILLTRGGNPKNEFPKVSIITEDNQLKVELPLMVLKCYLVLRL